MLPGESIEAVDAEVEALVGELNDSPGPSVRWRRLQTYAPAAVPTDCRLATRLREHAGAVADAPTDPWGIEAATDVRNLVNDAGMEAVTWGPGSLAQAHTVDESIRVADLVATANTYRRTLDRFLG